MLKHLNQRFSKQNRRKGFTLTELMITVGIIAVVCAIAIPSVIAIRNSLNFKQRNEYAKEVFMAAQERLTKMRSEGGLAKLQDAGGAKPLPERQWVDAGLAVTSWSGEYVYTSSNGASTEAFNLILPEGAIDDTVRKNQILIEYNPITGSVLSVFYSEEGTTLSYSGSGAVTRDEAERKKLMLGYCSGSDISAGEFHIENVAAEVEFENGQEGMVTVRVNLPELYSRLYNTFAEGLEVELEIQREAFDGSVSEETQSIEIPIKASGDIGSCTLSDDGKYVSLSYPIDSLVDRGSFVNLSAESADASLTSLKNETGFRILPGENVTIIANARFISAEANAAIDIKSGIVSGVNPMFGSLTKNGTSEKYVLTVANGRNLQNLNALSPQIAEQVEAVSFSEDINWNDTVTYYNEHYGTYSGKTKSYKNSADEAPARQLPYFVPIHSEKLFGEAYFGYPQKGTDLWDRLETLLQWLFPGASIELRSNDDVPTLTDEFDYREKDKTQFLAPEHAVIQGNGHKVSYIKTDSTKYVLGKDYYAGTTEANADRFTGLFGYVNTTVNNLYVVNPSVKGYYLEGTNNPATGALIGCAGYNTLVTNCGVYIDTEDPGFNRAQMTYAAYNKTGEQNWYGVSGEGAVGGLIGYAKSHRTVEGDLATDDPTFLAFSRCFAAVNVSGNMRGGEGKCYGYSNGVGGFIGNSELTNFFNCYASGDVYGAGGYATGGFSGAYDWGMFYNGKYSMGFGGFVGTSHGTRYTNCFATGDVEGKTSGSNTVTTGSFVGVMCYDESRAYGNLSDSTKSTDQVAIAQHTVFSSCYAAGLVKCNNTSRENFSGANARIKANVETFQPYLNADYYKMYAPYVLAKGVNNRPRYDVDYVYKDCYYLCQYENVSDDNTNKCATSAQYEELQELHLHTDSFIGDRISNLKKVSLTFSDSSSFFRAILGSNFLSRILQVVTNLGSAGKVDIYFKIYDRENGSNSLENLYTTFYRDGFNANHWGAPSEGTTHSYSMNDSGWVYPFSKLKDMDYYGDWPGKPITAGLAYYEQYKDGSYGYYFTDDRVNTLENENIVSDGYAIFTGSKSDTVTAATYTAGGTKIATASTSSSAAANKIRYVETTNMYENARVARPYSVFLLPSSMLQAASDGYYTRLDVSVTTTTSSGVFGRTTTETKTYTMYFNPNTAISQVNPLYNTTTANLPSSLPKQIFIRTPRQLTALTQSPVGWGEKYHYVQMLNLDMSAYTAGSYTNASSVYSASKTLTGIGTATAPFSGSYSGSGGYTEKAEITALKTEGGLFGIIGTQGSVSNLKLTVAQAGSDASANSSGILACENNGKLENIELGFAAGKENVSVKAKENAGVLTGLNRGDISDCTVTAGIVTLNGTNGGVLAGKSAYGTVSGFTVDITEVNSTCSGAVGILIGSMSETEIEGSGTAVTGTVKGKAAQMGGLVGYAEGGELNHISVTLSGENGGTNTSEIGGAIGSAMETSFTDVTVNIPATASLNAKHAAGFIGSVSDMKFVNCNAVINGSILGSELAGGFGCSLRDRGYVSGSTVTLDGAAVKGAQAAGFAVNGAGSFSGSDVLLSDLTTITGTENASGYLCTNAKDSEIVNCNVNGSAKITAESAVGFILTNSGTIKNCIVSPARHDSANLVTAYRSSDNGNLTITGSKNAAGLTLENNGELNGVSVLGTVTDGDNHLAAGLAVRNTGAVIRCMANTAVNGSALVGINDGTVTNSYAWYTKTPKLNAGKADDLTEDETGCYFSCYFAQLELDSASHPLGSEDQDGVVFLAEGCSYGNGGTPADGTFSVSMPLSALTEDLLNGEGGTAWTEGLKYGDGLSFHEIKPITYPYPLIHAHYGDWTFMAQPHHGAAYYEKTPDGTYHLCLIDSSELSITGDHVSYDFDNIDSIGNMEIVESGYVLFCKETNQFRSFNDGAIKNPEFTERSDIAENADFTGSKNIDKATFTEKYHFYELKTGMENLTSFTGVDSHTTYLETGYARAIRLDKAVEAPYEIRTAKQLENVKNHTGSEFNQTHNITLTSDFAVLSAFSGSYHGNGCSIDLGGKYNLFGNLSGTVENLTLKGTVSSTTGFDRFGLLAIKATNAALRKVKAENVDITLRSAQCVGVLVGETSGGSMEDCTVSGKLTVNTTTEQLSLGGLTGKATNTALSGCKADNLNLDITAKRGELGGISGTVSGGSLTNCTFGGKLTAKTTADTLSVGGIGGKAETVTVEDCAAKTCTIDVTSAKTDAGGLFGSISGSKMKNCTVSGKLTVSSTAEGVAAGGFLGRVTDTDLEGGRAEQAELEVTAKQADVGGIAGIIADASGQESSFTGIAMRDKSEVMTEDSITVTVTAPKANIGGFVGQSNGVINDNKLINVTLNYRQQEGNETVNIGGFVGKMNGGSLGKDGKETKLTKGSVQLVKPDEVKSKKSAKEIKEAVKAAEDGTKTYTVGGAVGMDAENAVTYTGVDAETALDAQWSVSTASPSANNPSGLGSVGKFVGHIHKSTFDTCSGTGASSAKFIFLGTIDIAKSGSVSGMYYGDRQSKTAKSDTVTDNGDGTFAFTDSDSTVITLYSAAGLYNDGMYYNYNASIVNCKYVMDGKTYLQEILTPEYYYTNGGQTGKNGYKLSKITAMNQLKDGESYVFADKNSQYSVNAEGSSQDRGKGLKRINFASTFKSGDEMEKALWQYSYSSSRPYWLNESSKTYLSVYAYYFLGTYGYTYTTGNKSNVSDYTFEGKSDGTFTLSLSQRTVLTTAYCWLDPAQAEGYGLATRESSITGFLIYLAQKAPYWIFNYNTFGQVILSTPLN